MRTRKSLRRRSHFPWKNWWPKRRLKKMPAARSDKNFWQLSSAALNLTLLYSLANGLVSSNFSGSAISKSLSHRYLLRRVILRHGIEAVSVISVAALVTRWLCCLTNVCCSKAHEGREKSPSSWGQHEAIKETHSGSSKRKLHSQRKICSGLSIKPGNNAFLWGGHSTIWVYQEASRLQTEGDLIDNFDLIDFPLISFCLKKNIWIAPKITCMCG